MRRSLNDIAARGGRASLVALAAALALGACPGPQKPRPADPKAVAGDKAAGDASAGNRVSGTAAAPPTADVSGDLLGVVRASSLDALLQAGTSYVAGQLPPPFNQMVQPQRLKQALLARLAQLDLDRAIDAARPVALAVLDPRVYGDRGLGPLVLAVPVLQPQPLVDGLARELRRHETEPWGDHRFGEAPKEVHLRIDRGYALLAGSSKALAGAAKLLRPHLDQAPARGAWVRVEAERINQRYAKQIERLVRRMGRGYFGLGGRRGKSHDKTLAYVRGVRALEASLDLQPKQIRVRVEAQSQPKGALADYLAGLGSGPAWGAEYLPADSALMWITRSTPAAQLKLTKEAFGDLAGLLGKLPGGLGKELTPYADRWQKLLVELVQQQSTAVGAAALWATADGGIGLGGVGSVKDPAAAQRLSVTALETFGKDVDRLLQLAATRAKKQMPRIGLTTRVRRGAFRHGAVRGDLVQLSIRWPRITKRSARALFSAPVAEARAKIKRLKDGLRTLFGPAITVAFVSTTTKSGEKISLVALGRDYQKRLEAMLAVAAGKRTSGVERTVASLAGTQPLTAFTYAPLASLVEQSLRVADKLGSVPAQIKNLAHQMLPPSGHDVPLAFWMRKRGGDRLEVEGSISSDLVGLLFKGTYFAFSGRSAVPSVRPQP